MHFLNYYRGYVLFSDDECSFLDLTPEQVTLLEQRFHIYLPQTGRINIAGLNQRSLAVFTRALDQIMRGRLHTTQLCDDDQQKPLALL